MTKKLALRPMLGYTMWTQQWLSGSQTGLTGHATAKQLPRSQDTHTQMPYLLPLLLLQQLEQLRLLLQVPASRGSKSRVTCRLLLVLLLPSKAPCVLQALALQATMLSKPQLPLQLLLGRRQKVAALLALPGGNLLALLLLLLQQQLPAPLPLQQGLLDRLAKAQHAAECGSHLQSPEGGMVESLGLLFQCCC